MRLYTTILAVCFLPVIMCKTRCIDGWRFHNDHCYKFVEKDRGYNDSIKYCESLGSYLVKVESKDEMKFLTDSIKDMKPYAFFELYWTGAHRDSNNDFKWQDGSSLSESSSLWFSGEPTSIYEQATCLLMDNDEYGLIDFIEEEILPSICEYEIIELHN